MTIEVELTERSIIKGVKVPIEVRSPLVQQYEQIQIEIYDVGVKNPRSWLGFGTVPVFLEENKYSVELDSSKLNYGIYEIRFVRVHSPKNQSSDEKHDFIGGKDFKRTIFEIISSDQLVRKREVVEREALEEEKRRENEFFLPMVVNENPNSTASSFVVLVFIKKLLIGTRTRFDRFEVIPTGGGLDAKDHLNFVNHFLQTTKLGVEFKYETKLKSESRHSNPVCVVHFPNIVASSHEEARQYADAISNRLLKALALTRDASGKLFDIVVYERSTGKSIKFSIRTPYVGNLLTGGLAGENAETLEKYIKKIGDDRFLESTVALYKEARAEPNQEFQYLRFWQILEVLAERKNYDGNENLLDFEGNPIMDGTRERKISGSIAIVFNLLKKHGIGSSSDTWKNVNIWYAFRNAIVHHGSIDNYTKLSRRVIRDWAEKGIEEIRKSNGHDTVLWNFREDVKLVLQKELAA